MAFWESEWLEQGHLGMRTCHEGNRCLAVMTEMTEMPFYIAKIGAGNTPTTSFRLRIAEH